MREDALSQISSEFKLWGVKFSTRDTNGGHIELRWQASPDKQVRSYVIAKTPSDWRGNLNNRAEIRRLFKADGLTLDRKPCAKVKPILAKALSLPEPVEKDADQIRMLRAEVSDLSELVLEMAGMISSLKDAVAAQAAPMPVQIAAPVVEVPTFLPPPAPPQQPLPLFQVLHPIQKKRSVRSIKTIDYVSDAWSSTDAIARDMGLKNSIAYMKLYYLMRKDIIEMSDGRWRKKPVTKPVIAAIAANKRKANKANGHRKH